MAGDWIKVEKSTARKPEIMGIARELSISMDAAFGLCFRFWCWCDDNLTNGNVFCVTESLLDETFGKQNFASAMVKVGWLQFDGDQMTVPNFERHLSKGAKTRAETAIRVAECKKRKREERYSGNESVTKKALPEKRREEKNKDNPPNPPSGGEGTPRKKPAPGVQQLATTLGSAFTRCATPPRHS